MQTTNLRRLIIGCLACSLLSACGNSSSGSQRQDETSMFSLFGKKKTESAPTTVNPLLQAELQRIESFPDAPAAPAPSSTATCTKYGIGGKPPQIVLKGGQEEILASNADFGFVISDRPDRAVLLMNLPHEVPDA